MVDAGPHPLLGEAHHDRGPVLLAWDQVRSNARHRGRSRNVVLHEFAHKMDMLDGVVDGTPLLPDQQALDRWIAVCEAEFESMRRGEAGPLLDDYGATDPGEFFAVATEAFFGRPVDFLRGQTRAVRGSGRLLPAGSRRPRAAPDRQLTIAPSDLGANLRSPPQLVEFSGAQIRRSSRRARFPRGALEGHVVERNWAGNIEYGAARFHTPTSVDEVQSIVVGCGEGARPRQPPFVQHDRRYQR